MASECNFPRAFRKKSTHRAKSSYPRCQHSCSEIISATKPPKRRNMPGICLTKPSQPGEYHHIPDWSAGTVPQDPLYSAEYSGTRSFGGPSIFRKKFRNIWQRPTRAPCPHCTPFGSHAHSEHTRVCTLQGVTDPHEGTRGGGR